jgi:hypothetical protein
MVSRAIASLALCAIALAAASIACEIAVRVLDGQPILALRLPAPRMPVPQATRLAPWLAGRPRPADVDPNWIDMNPPPLSNRGRVDPDILKRVRAVQGTEIKPFEVFRIWNRLFVEKSPCGPRGRFRHMPQPLLVFDPPEPSPDPPFRYPPSQTLPGGLVTNRFGWRGPDLPLDKPPRTVRVAFVGASTTVGLYSLPFSYPEYVVHWLNLWAAHAGLDVRFDGINAGREGINSTVIAAIVRQELPAAEPDLVLYYEGANQSLCVQPPAEAPKRPPRGSAVAFVDRIATAGHERWALARRLEEAVVRFEARGGTEPPKPKFEPRWPTGIDEARPDITSKRLPDRLQRILIDLDSARTALDAAGSELALSSFAWLVYDGLRLDPIRHPIIYRHLNEGCWPYRYADLRRALDLHNHVLEQYAHVHGLGFIDVAADFPMDPALFFDAIHLNADGTRAHAWIAFQGLLPIVRARLESGAWPRPDRVPLQEHPAIGPGRPYPVSCDSRATAPVVAPPSAPTAAPSQF